MRAQVVEEVVDGGGEVVPQRRKHIGLAGVRVEASVVAVEHARSQVRHMHLRDALELLGKCGVGVLNIGGVAFRRNLQDVRALQGVQARLSEKLHHGASADCLSVQAREAVQYLLALLFGADAGHQAVVVQVFHARHRHARHRHSAEHAGAEAYAGYHILFARVDLLDDLAEPAFGAYVVRLAGVPDVHRAEVRAGRVFVAHAVDDGDVALIVHIADCAHLRVQPYLVVKVKHLLLGNADRGAVVVVEFVVVRDDGVEIVVAARKLNNNHNRIFLRGGHFAAPSQF